MSVKSLLKQARGSLESHDPESCLDYVDEILKTDKNNYFAYVFQGKAFQSLDKIDKAIGAYDKAISIQPEDMLAWKGLHKALAQTDRYEAYFDVLARIIDMQVGQGISIAETLKDLRNYLAERDYKSDYNLNVFYLKSIIPGTVIGDLIGTSLGLPEENIKRLIDLVRNHENDLVRRANAKVRMTLPKTLNQLQLNKLNQSSWDIRLKSELEHFYQLLLNVCNDDGLRKKYEKEYLKYKYDLLSIAPEKEPLQQDLFQMVEGMVFVKSPCLLAWQIYFDWIDLKHLSSLQMAMVTDFLDIFKNEGLSLILYAYAMSDISPFNKEEFTKRINYTELGKSNRRNRRRRRSKKNKDQKKPDDTDDSASITSTDTNDDDHLLDKVDDDDDVQDGEGDKGKVQSLSPSEALALMITGYDKCKDSVLGNRIICAYYIHLREYSEGSLRCREAISLLAKLKTSHGIDLPNTKEDLICSLAISYTYFEAPKNFPRALQLYDNILSLNPDNVKAKIGKGLILMERNDWQTATKLFQEVNESNPDDIEAALELAWCKILTGDVIEGRNRLIQVLDKLTGFDLISADKRAVVRWRIAQSYILDKSDASDINEAYQYLINSLKDSKNHAPSYTSLGILYQDHYNDKARGQKCFYKAFELDASEITAAKYLVEESTANNEWDVAELLCERIVTTEKSRRKLFTDEVEDKSWPFRVLGCSALNKQGDAKAIEWFQSALRMKAMDIECWIGLGEAYFNCGRLDAAAKVFTHVLTINESLWVVQYMLGKVNCEMGEFVEGLEILEKALELKPNEECIIMALYENYLNYTQSLVLQGFLGRALENIVKSIAAISLAAKINAESQNLWKVLSDCLRYFISLQGNLDVLPLDTLREIFESVNPDSLEGISFDGAQKLFEEKLYVDSLSILIILAGHTAVEILPKKSNRYLRSATLYNFGLAYLEAYNACGNEDYRNLAIKTLKKAIQLEQNNVTYWVALGNAFVSFNPQVAQHCFIKATTLDSRDGDIWTNIAALYLRYGDADLAMLAFLRSQSLSPQKSQSWIGHALTAQAKNEDTQAANLFTHAYVLSNGRSPLAQLLYGLSIIDKRVKTPGSDPRNIEAAQEFSIANYAMQKYLKSLPRDVLGLKLALTISERCKLFDYAAEIGEKLCEILESNYEKGESEADLLEFAIAKTQLSRIYLGNDQYEKAIENAQMTLDILEGELEEDEKIKASILSSRIVIVLSFFFNDQFDEALEELKVILSHHSSTRLITLTAQILYAYGSEDTKQAALDQLFGYIEESGSSLPVVLMLGAISVVDNLEEYLVPVKDELLGLPLTELINDSFKTVPRLLSEINKGIGGAEGQIWQRAAMLFPQDYNVWKQLNSGMALTVATLHENKQPAAELAEAYAATKRLRELQRALLLCPNASHAGALKNLHPN